MSRVFLLTSAGGPTGAETLARTALAALPEFPHESAVAGLCHAFDFAELSRLRERVRAFGPDVLHAVGPGAVRAAGLLKLPRIGLKPFPRLVVSGCDAPDGWLARRGLARADTVLAYTPGQEQRYREFVKPERVRRVPPAVSPPRKQGPLAVANSSEAAGPSLARRADTITIAAVGNFDRDSGLKTAVAAFDVLKYTAPDLELLLIGDGPGRAEVEAFGRAVGYDDYRVRFAGRSEDVPRLLESATVTWIARPRGGTMTALESMSVGTPVVAFGTPDIEAVVVDGQTGRLVPLGDRMALASATAGLLNQSGELCRLGEAGKRTVRERYTVGPLAEATVAAYVGG